MLRRYEAQGMIPRRKTTPQPFKKPERRLVRDAEVVTTAEVSLRMGRVRRSGTAPELAVRRVARDIGLRYTLRNGDLPGRPDLANRSRRIAVFVHGCFWHRHPNCPKASTPRSNVEFWRAKFKRNVERDLKVRNALISAGFTVVTIWECTTVDPRHVRSALRRALRQPSRRLSAPSRRIKAVRSSRW